jgi:hypothetical protein
MQDKKDDLELIGHTLDVLMDTLHTINAARYYKDAGNGKSVFFMRNTMLNFVGNFIQLNSNAGSVEKNCDSFLEDLKEVFKKIKSLGTKKETH